MTLSDRTTQQNLPKASPTDTTPTERTNERNDRPMTATPPQTLPADRLRLFGSRYALLGVWALMIVVYGTLMPQTFLNATTARAILSSQSALVFLSIAVLITFLIGEFDLSFASVMGLSATTIPVLTTLHGVNIAVACLVALAAAVGCGLLNAFFIVVLKVPPLIVTLGTASLFLGIAQLISGATVLAVSNRAFSDVALHPVMGLPLSFYYGLLLALAVAYFLAWTPAGRHVVFVGANPEVARLAGINVELIRALCYITTSFVSGMAGVLLIMTVGGFDPTASATYLLPGLAAVFLGSAIVRPGQVNPMGTWLGIYFLATGIFGLQLLGYTGWVQDVFYGAGLVLAVTLTTFFRRRARVA